MLDKNQIKLHINWQSVIQLLFFFVSFVNPIVLAAWMVTYFAIFLLTQDKKVAIRFFIYVQVRSILNAGIAVSISSVGIIKWICVLGISIMLIIICYPKTVKSIQKLIVLFTCFSAYSILSALIVSSYPLVAVFKVVSYILPFIAIILAINDTKGYNWIHEINILLGFVVIVSIFVYPFSVGYLRNGRFFQGLFNHPNILGVMIAIFIAGYIYENLQNVDMLSFAIILALCMFMVYKSYSRTGMISLLIVLFLGICFLNIPSTNKRLLIISIVIFFVIVLVENQSWREEVQRFFLKGGESIYDVADSRKVQVDNNLDRFFGSPLFGTGFNVPYRNGVRDFSFSFDLITENGNLILALLGDLGLIGTILFFICYIEIFLLGKGNINGYTIFVVPFLVCMGEMSFFSTNNFGIILYLYFAIYISDNMNSVQKKAVNSDENSFFDNNPITI